MKLLDNINQLFKRDSVSSNVNMANTSSLKNRISLKFKGNGISYATGMKILLDTQVSTGFDILKYILSSKQWVLVSNDEDTNEEVYNFIHNMLFNLETEVNEIIKQMLPAILWGYSVHEILYDLDSDGKLIVNDLVPLHIKTLQNEPFIYDNNGELIGIHQQYDNVDVDIPINKVLKYSFNAKYDEDYGYGLLWDFRPIVEDKINLNNWLMTYNERHEAPILYGKANSNMSSKKMLQSFTEVNGGKSGLTVGVDEEVGVLESSHRGETFFKTLQYKDNQIFRRYYLGNLLLGDNSQTGTYAQSQTQLDFGQLIFDGLLEELANCFQKQIINPIVEANFGSINLSPTFSFDKFTTGDLTSLFNIIKPLMDSGVVDSENDAVQEAIGLLFKKETGLNYNNNEELPVMDEDFELPPIEDTANLTENIIDTITV